jgi:hypothetical protein
MECRRVQHNLVMGRTQQLKLKQSNDSQLPIGVGWQQYHRWQKQQLPASTA